MTAEERHARLDDATVFMLEATSHDGDSRTFLASCKYCSAPFWVKRGRCRGTNQLYCSGSCRTLRYYVANYTRVRARQSAYQARRRAERVAS